MKDAELMTTEPTVPWLEVEATGNVFLNKELIGWVRVTSFDWEAVSITSVTRVSRQTRNDAVKWILDQHKPSHATCTEMPF